MARFETLVCANCHQPFRKEVGQANRQRRGVGPDVPFFCRRACHQESRRLHKPKTQRVAEKAAYDRKYRERNLASIKAKKHDYTQRTYDPDKARRERAAKLEWHRAYAKTYREDPKWKDHKREYDREYTAAAYGEFAECHALLIELDRAVRVQPWYERARERGYYNNGRTTQERRP